jgi:hypothetical protein
VFIVITRVIIIVILHEPVQQGGWPIFRTVNLASNAHDSLVWVIQGEWVCVGVYMHCTWVWVGVCALLHVGVCVWVYMHCTWVWVGVYALHVGVGVYALHVGVGVYALHVGVGVAVYALYVGVCGCICVGFVTVR